MELEAVEEELEQLRLTVVNGYLTSSFNIHCFLRVRQHLSSKELNGTLKTS